MKSLKQMINESSELDIFSKKKWDGKTLSIGIRKGSNYDSIKTVKMPKGKYFVINDPYKRAVHLVAWGDLRSYAVPNQRDSYEDFDARDVLYATDDVQDAAKWMLKNLVKDGAAEFPGESWHDIDVDKAKGKKTGAKYNGIYDNADVLNQYLNGENVEDMDDTNEFDDYSDYDIAEMIY
jgi:hypothetical protein